MPTLLIRGPDGTLVERELEGRLTVGCDDDNDLVLRSNGVEKRHANFFAEGGEVVLEQLESTPDSAKTIVDGAPMRGRKKLAPGVRVVIGDYEVQLKPQQVTVRRVDSAAAAAPPAAFPFKRVFGLFGVALLAIVAAGVWRRLDSAPETKPPPPPVTDPCADLEPWLRVAREGASEKALQALDKVLECDPIHAEANKLKRSIPLELEAQALAARAKEFLELGRDAQALEAIEKIQLERIGVPLFQEVAPRVAKEAKADCDQYTKAGKKALAQPRCDEYARLTAKLGAAKPKAPEGPSLAERVLARLQEPALAEPVLLYAAGRNAEAIVKLQKIRESSSQARLHARADALRKDITDADGLYKVSEHALEKGQLERGAKALREAFEPDARILPEGGSALRKSGERLVAQKAYEAGVVHAQRQNWVQACASWKSGFEVYKGNTDLNQAVARDCTQRAADLLTSGDCKGLDQARALAVPGDELEPKISARRRALGCE